MRPELSKKVVALAVFIGLIGIGWLAISAVSLRKSITIALKGQILEATIDKIEGSVDYDIASNRSDDRKHHRIRKSTSYTATLSYTDPQGERQTSLQAVSRIHTQLKEGGPVAIRYVPGDPPMVNIDGQGSPWRDLVPAAIGLVFLLISWLILRFGRYA